jgi:hypothetical protein
VSLLAALLSISFFFAQAEAQNSVTCPRSLFEDKTLKSGCLWEMSGEQSEVRTLHFSAKAQQSHYLIQYQENQIYVYNHTGKLRLQLRDGRELMVPAGFEVWISELQRNKKNGMGVITPIDIKKHTARLHLLWDKGLEEFKSYLNPLVVSWGPRQDIASRYYKGLVERKLASVETEKNRQLRKVQKEQSIRRRNKELMFDRAFSR